jgi:uncharacterized membrane protein (UPF0127 family)
MKKTMKNKQKLVRVQSVKNSLWIADQCLVADSFLTRLKGLIGRKLLNEGEGLLLIPCNDIHMWFMSLPIDAVFLVELKSKQLGDSKKMRVCSVKKDFKPWSLLPVRDRSATTTLELPRGTIDRCDVCPGDELCIS